MSTRPVEFRIGLGSCGIANGARAVRDALAHAVQEAGRGTVKPVGCGGLCHREPLVEVVEDGHAPVVYNHVTADVAGAIVRRHVRPRGWLTRLRWLAATNPRVSPAAPTDHDTPRIVLENCGIVDPGNIDDYLGRDGYRALRRCREQLTPDRVIETIEASGLRGRGGAGFPAAEYGGR